MADDIVCKLANMCNASTTFLRQPIVLLNKDRLFNLLSPLAQPGFDALGISAPVIIQANSAGKWENQKPSCLDEERLKAVVQHLTNSNAISAAKSYCCQCALDNKNAGLQSNYVPVIMMPIYPADECPFEMDCEIQKMQQAQKTTTKKTKGASDDEEVSDEKKPTSKPKKRGFVMQRLTNFDLLSQW